MKCEEARELFKKLYRERNFIEIGRTFKELRGKELRCFESGAMELDNLELEDLKDTIRTLLSEAKGKEKPLAPELIERVLKEGVAVYLIKRVSKGYPTHIIAVRFRDGSQRTIKHRSSRDAERTYEIYGALKTYISARDT